MRIESGSLAKSSFLMDSNASLILNRLDRLPASVYPHVDFPPQITKKFNVRESYKMKLHLNIFLKDSSPVRGFQQHECNRAKNLYASLSHCFLTVTCVVYCEVFSVASKRLAVLKSSLVQDQ